MQRNETSVLTATHRPESFPNRRTVGRVGASAVLAVALVGLLLAAGAGEAAADDGFTVEPDTAADHHPGEAGDGPGNASYAFFGVTNVTIDYVEGFEIRWEAGVASKCYRGDLRTYGIDRGDTFEDEGVDEEAIQYTDGTNRTDDRVYVQFYPRNGLVGETTNLDAGDELVLAAENCVRNPDSPGWYRLSIRFNGTMEDESHRETRLRSNYVWICECENESQARERLGPPPNEREASAGDGPGTPTPDSTPDRTPTATRRSTDAEAATPTAERTATPTPPGTTTDPTASTASTPTGTDDPAATAAADGAGSPTGTAGDGPGFGALVAVIAALLTAIATRRDGR